MHSFTDVKGKEWSVDLDLSKAFEIEEYNFAQAFGQDPEEADIRLEVVTPPDKFFDTYIVNTKIVFTILWILCRKEAADAGVENIEKFAQRFDGDTLNKAKFAFFGELQGFFPERAMTLKASIQKYFDAVALMDKKMAAKIEQELPMEELESIVDKQTSGVMTSIKEQMRKDSTGI